MKRGDEPAVAAVKAGKAANYTEEQIEKALVNKNVAAAVAHARNQPATKSAIAAVLSPPLTREERRSLLADIARPSGQCKVPEQLKAIELDGKMEGDFIDRKQVDSRVLVRDMDKMSDEELLKLLVSQGIDLEVEEDD
jgi:hypothetical protein